MKKTIPEVTKGDLALAKIETLTNTILELSRSQAVRSVDVCARLTTIDRLLSELLEKASTVSGRFSSADLVSIVDAAREATAERAAEG